MTVGDCIGRTGFHAIATENAAGIIDVINAGVAFASGDAVGIDVFRGFDINTICGAGGSAQEAANALFQAAFVPVEYVDPAVARLEMHRLVRIIFRNRLAKHSAEGYAEALH